MKELKGWCDEPDAPENVRAVYAYLQKGTLSSDLERTLTLKK